MPRSRPSLLQLSAPRLARNPDLWILVAGAIFYAALASCGRFQQPDFHAYYAAASRFLHGDPLYFVTEPAPYVPYLYMPAVALAFAPFLVASLPTAAVAWYACNVLLLVAARRLLRRQSGDPGGARLALFFAAVGFALERELSVGNLNLLNLVLALLAISLAAEEHWGFAGLALACGVTMKPPAGLLALPMLARRRRLILPAAIAGAALLAAPLFFYGRHGTPGLYGEFLRSTADFHRRFADSFKYRATTAGLWEDLLALAGARTHHHWSGLLLQYGLAAAALAASYLRFRGGLRALYVALALAPLTALCDYQVFMLAAPLLYHLLCEWRAGDLGRARLALLLASVFLYGCNWHDLWGDRLSKRLFDAGVQGIGDWGLIACALTARPRGVHRDAAWRADVGRIVAAVAFAAVLAVGLLSACAGVIDVRDQLAAPAPRDSSFAEAPREKAGLHDVRVLCVTGTRHYGVIAIHGLEADTARRIGEAVASTCVHRMIEKRYPLAARADSPHSGYADSTLSFKVRLRPDRTQEWGVHRGYVVDDSLLAGAEARRAFAALVHALRYPKGTKGWTVREAVRFGAVTGVQDVFVAETYLREISKAGRVAEAVASVPLTLGMVIVADSPVAVVNLYLLDCRTGQVLLCDAGSVPGTSWTQVEPLLGALVDRMP